MQLVGCLPLHGRAVQWRLRFLGAGAQTWGVSGGNAQHRGGLWLEGRQRTHLSF